MTPVAPVTWAWWCRRCVKRIKPVVETLLEKLRDSILAITKATHHRNKMEEARRTCTPQKALKTPNTPLQNVHKHSTFPYVSPFLHIVCTWTRTCSYHVVYVRVLPAPAPETQLAICIPNSLSESELRCRPLHRCETWLQVSQGIVLTIHGKIRWSSKVDMTHYKWAYS